MINLNLKHNQKFTNNTHLGIFYAIVDVYQNKGSAVNDIEMVKILKGEYGLDVERRTIKRYRDFLLENFDINLKYYKKGYYVQTKKDYELENEKKITTIEEVLEQYNHEKAISIKYNKEDMIVDPLEINYINGDPYLLCLNDAVGEGIAVKNLRISRIAFNKPLVVENKINVPYPYDEYLYCSEYPWGRDLETIPDEEPYKITSTVVFKKDAPVKELRRAIKKHFSFCKSKSIIINNESYRSITFQGDSLDAASFVVRNRRFFVKIIGKSLLEEIHMMYGI